jgi:hypothetical protein
MERLKSVLGHDNYGPVPEGREKRVGLVKHEQVRCMYSFFGSKGFFLISCIYLKTTQLKSISRRNSQGSSF